jgi:hypothetical protein
MSAANQQPTNNNKAGRRSARLAWAILAFSTLFFTIGLGFNVANGVRLNSDLLTSTVFFLFAPTGTLIALRRPENAIGWIYCAIGLADGCSRILNEYLVYTTEIRPGALPGAEWVALSLLLLASTSWIGLFMSIVLFPTGRFLSARWGIAGWATLVMLILTSIFSIFTLDTLWSAGFPNPFKINDTSQVLDAAFRLGTIAGFILLIPCLLSIVLRFKWSRGDERQQLKWFYYSVLLLVPAFVISSLTNAVGAFQNNVLVQLFLTWSTVIIAAIPVSVAIAILRYRLYDIDLLIRSTLLYGALTGVLGLIYWGGVVSLQALLQPITGPGNDLAIVATTLAVAAIFLPLRRRIQSFIDRRFYRRKYNAEKTLAAFSETARDEVNLDTLSERLVDTIEETMRPEHVSMWLRPVNPTKEA